MNASQTDIIPDWVPVSLGEGWYAPERTSSGDMFRWAAETAWIHIAQLAGLTYQVRFDIEPGPAVALEAFALAWYEDGRSHAATLSVPHRTRVSFEFRAQEAGLRHFELRAETKADAIAAPGDDRNLAYRIFSIDVTATAGVSRLERSIVEREHEIDGLRSAVRDLQHNIDADRDTAASRVAALSREIETRDAFVDRLERVAADLRTQIVELKQINDDKEAEIEFGASLAAERLAVIRALHEQNQRVD